MIDKSTAPSTKWWVAWTSFLVVVYLGISLVGWNRTLIPDEIRALLLADGPISEEMEYAKEDMIHPPLPYLLERGWLNVFGHTDAAAKASALLIGILTIISFSYLTRRITPGYWWILSLLFCAPYFRIGSSVNLVRMYGLLLLLLTLAMIAWDEWRKNPSTGRLAAWVAVMTLMVYTHGSALLMLPGFVAINWLYGSRRWTFMFVAAIPAVALLPWVLTVLPVYHAGFFDETLGWAYDNPTRVLTQIPFFFLSGEASGGGAPIPPLYVVSFRNWLIIAALLLNLALLLPALKSLRQFGLPKKTDSDTARWFWTALIMCGIPIVVLYIFSLLFLPVLHARYLLVALPMYWILVVILGELGGRLSRTVLVGAVVLWTMGSAGLTLRQNLTPSLPRAGTLHIAATMAQSDLILVTEHVPLGWQVYWEWIGRLKRPEPVEILWTDMPDRTQDIVPGVHLEELDLENADRVWLFYGHRTAMKPVAEYLESHDFMLEEQPELEHSNLKLFTRSGRQPSSVQPAALE